MEIQVREVMRVDEKLAAECEDSVDVEETIDKDSKPDMEVGRIIMYRQIGAKVAYYRTLRQLTQDELARRVHISRSTLNRIERGRYNGGISLSTLMDIAEGLHIELSNLVSFTEEEKKVWWDVDVHLK